MVSKSRTPSIEIPIRAMKGIVIELFEFSLDQKKKSLANKIPRKTNFVNRYKNRVYLDILQASFYIEVPMAVKELTQKISDQLLTYWLGWVWPTLSDCIGICNPALQNIGFYNFPSCRKGLSNSRSNDQSLQFLGPVFKPQQLSESHLFSSSV